MDSRVQTGVILLVFAKTFDIASHPRLMTKLSPINLWPNVLSWIHAFFTNCFQRCFVKNTLSNTCSVASGVPQDSVVGLFLYLVFINDLPDCFSSSIRLFAGHFVIYRTIYSSDTLSLQHVLNSVLLWCFNWLLSSTLTNVARFLFNALVLVLQMLRRNRFL